MKTQLYHTGKSEADHLHNLEAVLREIQEYGIWLKREKCSFFQEAVDYLGHHISAQGVRTFPMKLKGHCGGPQTSERQRAGFILEVSELLL